MSKSLSRPESFPVEFTFCIALPASYHIFYRFQSNLALVMFSTRHCESPDLGLNINSPLFRNFIWDLALTKLYSNCLLSTLNARASLQDLSGYSPSGARHAVSSDRNRRLVCRYFSHTFLLAWFAILIGKHDRGTSRTSPAFSNFRTASLNFYVAHSGLLDVRAQYAQILR